ncbi:hypothetical protein WEI85_08710 [Actinomycetes bacterium KLBMP 9797]
MPDPMFRTLFDDTETTPWAPVGEVRERARRRVRRARTTAVAAAVASVVAISGGVAVAQRDDQPGPGPLVTPGSPTHPTPPPPTSPPVTPPTSPATTAITDGMFLRPEDVGAGYRASTGKKNAGDWTFEYSASTLGCPEPDVALSPLASQQRTLSRGTPQDEDSLTQYVARYPAGGAAGYLQRVRARVDACEPAGGQSIRIAQQRFAGQDALLITVDYGEGFTTTHVLVREGDLLTEFFAKPERGNAAMRALGEKAAQHLP